MFVDESGDSGLTNSPTTHFILSGLVVHELRWASTLQQLKQFRKRVRQLYGLKLDEELHAAALINRPGKLKRIKRHRRLAILRAHARELGQLQDCMLVNVVVDKTTKPAGYDVFEHAWEALVQRFENTIRHGNFPGRVHAHDRGLLLADDTDGQKLTKMLRRMRYFNPVANQAQFGGGFRNLTLNFIVEDPVFRRSDFSYFIQGADTAAYLLQQSINPNTYMRSKGGNNYVQQLLPIYCNVCSGSQNGVVYL